MRSLRAFSGRWYAEVQTRTFPKRSAIMNEWNNRKGEIEDADRQVAATLAAALIARGFNMPNTAMAAA